MKDFQDFLEEHPEQPNYNLDPEKMSERERLLNRCKERSLYLLTDAEKTEKKLREKLARSGKYDTEIIEETITFLKKYQYIDDKRFARRLIESYKGKKSLREIEHKLYERGVSSADIREVISEYRESEESEEAELLAIRKLIQKKCKDSTSLDMKSKQKLYASLMRKGFSYSLISRALSLDEMY